MIVMKLRGKLLPPTPADRNEPTINIVIVMKLRGKLPPPTPADRNEVYNSKRNSVGGKV